MQREDFCVLHAYVYMQKGSVMQNLTGLPQYTGKTHPNCDYTHGQIPPARGVKCYQVARANRAAPHLDDGTGCTYKHAADLTWFAGQFYIQYLVNPEDEHTGAGFSVLACSQSGETWEDFQVSFPPYQIPACSIQDYKGLTHTFDGTSFAFMHQRMGFYNASQNRMLLLGFYGWSPHPWMTNWDNYGIGRVVRELYPDGRMGDIYFIRPNWQAGWQAAQLNYPLYDTCPDKGFVAACKELLGNALFVQQWAEENGDIDPIIQIKHPKTGRKNEAFCWYHINDSVIIGLWKHSMVARSNDNGTTWGKVTRSPSLVMSGQKVWGCKTSDGRFAMVYDPTLETQHRYPMCITTSEDGLHFDNMRLIHGEVPPMKYKGFWKDLGPQYMRGIAEGLCQPPDKDLWITYSVNKEDIWIAHIPVPVAGAEPEKSVEENFMAADALSAWNLYCPKWATARRVTENGQSFLRMTDREPYDYCRAERIFMPTVKGIFQFRLLPHQIKTSCLQIELLDAKGTPAMRLVFRDNGTLYARTVTEIPVVEYIAGQVCGIQVNLDCQEFRYTLAINDELQCDEEGCPIFWPMMSAVNTVSRFVLRTGAQRQNPSLNDDPEGKPSQPLPNCETPAAPAIYDLLHFQVK